MGIPVKHLVQCLIIVSDIGSLLLLSGQLFNPFFSHSVQSELALTRRNCLTRNPHVSPFDF